MPAVSIVPPQGNPQRQATRRRGRSLAHDLVEGVAEQIRSQSLKPGDKLPTESAIMQAWGVSRTVVREALSRLQAAGTAAITSTSFTTRRTPSSA